VSLAACNSQGSSRVPPVRRTPPPAEPGTSAALNNLPADPREPILAQSIEHLLEEKHLRRMDFDDDGSRKAMAEFLKRLDGAKLFLLKGHVTELQAYADKIDDQLADGNLALARSGAALMARRRQVVAKTVARVLAKPFDFSANEEIETDPDKLEFAATEEELADRWRRMLKLQALERIARMEEVAELLAANKSKGKANPGKPSPGNADQAGTGGGSAGLTRPPHGAPVDDQLAEAEIDPSEHLEDIPDTFEGREQKARADLAKSLDGRFKRLAKLEPLEPVETLLNAVAAIYDPHTVYLAPAEKANFDIMMSGSLEGIGAVLAEDDHYISVREIVPGGASWRQGDLHAGDLILAVSQATGETVDVIDMRINQVVQMIRGPKGTVVRLTVRKSDGRIKVISITRDVVEIEEAYARGALLKVSPKAAPVGYIELPSFYGNTRAQQSGTSERNATDDVRALLERFAAMKVQGVILDLRGNGGGLLDHARDITGLFIERGPVVQTRFSDGRSQVLEDDDPSVSFSGKVIVLVDRFSASASEILAGALQDYKRALIVGTGPTHGKGTVQMLVDLDRMARDPSQPMGVLKLTIQQFFRVTGDSTQWRGVVPDVVLPDPFAHVKSGERYLDHSIPWSEVDPLQFSPWTKSTWNSSDLAAQSVQRQAKEPAFRAVTTRGELLKARRDKSRTPLNLQVWKREREADRKALKAVDLDLDKGSARMKVEVLSYAEKPSAPAKAAPHTAPKNSSSADDRLKRWTGRLERDPWVTETLQILADM
jgi:carboxyl-terminal processing protease